MAQIRRGSFGMPGFLCRMRRQASPRPGRLSTSLTPAVPPLASGNGLAGNGSPAARLRRISGTRMRSRHEPGPLPGLAALEARLRHDLACLNYPPANWVPRRPRAAARCSTWCSSAAACAACGGLRAAAPGRAQPAPARPQRSRPRGPLDHLCAHGDAALAQAPDGPADACRRSPSAPGTRRSSARRRGSGSARSRGRCGWTIFAGIARARPAGRERRRGDSASSRRRTACCGWRCAAPPSPEVLARKVVLATGREGLGEPYVPDFVRSLPRGRWAHSAEPIDFAALRGSGWWWSASAPRRSTTRPRRSRPAPPRSAC